VWFERDERVGEGMKRVARVVEVKMENRWL